jgi:hypothetical protein
MLLGFRDGNGWGCRVADEARQDRHEEDSEERAKPGPGNNGLAEKNSPLLPMLHRSGVDIAAAESRKANGKGELR